MAALLHAIKGGMLSAQHGQTNDDQNVVTRYACIIRVAGTQPYLLQAHAA